MVKEAASDSLEGAGVCGSQLPVESMKSGVVTPCKLVDESLSGDWPFRAVPSGEISTGIFPSQPSDRTISGATDPGSSLVDHPVLCGFLEKKFKEMVDWSCFVWES